MLRGTKAGLILLWVSSAPAVALAADLAVERFRAQAVLEGLYRRAAVDKAPFHRHATAEQLMLAAVCAREKFGTRVAQTMVQQAKQRVLTTEAKTQNYLQTMANAPRLWKLPTQDELIVKCAEVAL